MTHSSRRKGQRAPGVPKPTAQQLKQAMALDQYYTQRPVAASCWDLFANAIQAHGAKLDTCIVLEPSAGDGAFLDTAPPGLRLCAMDLVPARPDVVGGDFLKDPAPAMWRQGQQQPSGWTGRLVVGNPPFGRKAAMASAFLERAFAQGADVVGFVLPVQFRKWSAQNRVPAGHRLLADHDLPEEAFDLLGHPYRVRCSFQIWAAPHVPENPAWPDRRLTTKPPVDHPDFQAWQYNRTAEAEKYFDRDWDFAVMRQGYVDYTHKAYKASDCDRKHQWIFFKAHNRRALRVLLNLDFEALSRKNIGTPGFGKADVVSAYVEAADRESHASFSSEKPS